MSIRKRPFRKRRLRVMHFYRRKISALFTEGYAKRGLPEIPGSQQSATRTLSSPIFVLLLWSAVILLIFYLVGTFRL